jgi:excisionase family DNA binding protein
LTDEWLTVDQLAAWLQIAVKTVYKLNSEGTGPRYVRVGRLARYRRRDVEAWLEAQYADAAR